MLALKGIRVLSLNHFLMGPLAPTRSAPTRTSSFKRCPVLRRSRVFAEHKVWHARINNYEDVIADPQVSTTKTSSKLTASAAPPSHWSLIQLGTTTRRPRCACPLNDWAHKPRMFFAKSVAQKSKSKNSQRRARSGCDGGRHPT